MLLLCFWGTHRGGTRRREGKYGHPSVSHCMDAGVWPGRINLEWSAWEVYGEEGSGSHGVGLVFLSIALVMWLVPG